jgi:hypothetical protein
MSAHLRLCPKTPTTNTGDDVQALRGERAELEQLLHESRSECGQLASQLSQAGAAEAAAREEAEAAQVLAAAARVAAEERAAELRVAQDTLRAMREEVNERWVRWRRVCSEHGSRLCVHTGRCERSVRMFALTRVRRCLRACANCNMHLLPARCSALDSNSNPHLHPPDRPTPPRRRAAGTGARGPGAAGGPGGPGPGGAGRGGLAAAAAAGARGRAVCAARRQRAAHGQEGGHGVVGICVCIGISWLAVGVCRDGEGERLRPMCGWSMPVSWGCAPVTRALSRESPGSPCVIGHTKRA